MSVVFTREIGGKKYEFHDTPPASGQDIDYDESRVFLGDCTTIRTIKRVVLEIHEHDLRAARHPVKLAPLPLLGSVS